MNSMRIKTLFVWLYPALFVLAVMVPFLVLMGVGFSGSQNTCITDGATRTHPDPFHEANSCYCECYGSGSVGPSCYDTTRLHKPGIRQPWNTWSNLYVFITVPLVLLWITLTLGGQLPSGSNLLNGTSDITNHFTSQSRLFLAGVYPLYFAHVLIFLGLGSMWFHASMIEWGGWFDNFSMYPYTTFLVAYSVLRLVSQYQLGAWGEGITVAGYCVVTIALCGAAVAGASSLYISVASSVVYVGLEIWVLVSGGKELWSKRWPGFVFLWIPAALSMIAATVVWKLSQTGGALCHHPSGFQGHGVWHWLSGVTGTLLFFYWRYAADRAP